jgi:RNA polymerase sigma factor (sigma-70 family)
MEAAMAGGEATRPVRPVLRSREEADRLVVETIARHAESLLALARRYSLCPDDAQDAYQRALEIFLRHAPTLDAADAHKWLHTVLKHETLRVRRSRMRLVAADEHDPDAHESPSGRGPDEQVQAFDRMTRSAEALQHLKPAELQALWLRAQGHSYDEIARLCGWTYTKVNRSITEGRRRFLERYAGIEAGDECRRWEPVLAAIADGEATAAQLLRARPHLRNCPGCRATVRALRESGGAVAALLPVSAAAAPRHGGVFARLVELVSGHVHERAASAALKVQVASEVAAASKMAAVAASAAALAGGGVAVDRAVVAAETHPHAGAERAHARAAAPHAAATATGPSYAAAPPPATRPAARPARPRATAAAEFGVSSQAKASAASADRDTAAQEFAAAPQPQPRAAAAGTGPSSAAASAAAREFGG